MTPFPGTIARSPDGYHHYILNDEQKAWLRDTFPVTENRLVAIAMGITYPTLYRIVSSLKLVKSEEGKKAIQKRQCEDHARMNRHHRLLMLSGHHPEKCTNIRVTPFTKLQINCRNRAVTKYGYMVYNGFDLRDDDADRYKIFYNKDTRRSARFEATCRKYGMTIEEEENYE
jgi:hypothetical protein